jgi:hypothetical protein
VTHVLIPRSEVVLLSIHQREVIHYKWPGNNGNFSWITVQEKISPYGEIFVPRSSSASSGKQRWLSTGEALLAVRVVEMGFSLEGMEDTVAVLSIEYCV